MLKFGKLYPKTFAGIQGVRSLMSAAFSPPTTDFPLITTNELANNLDKVVILDNSWFFGSKSKEFEESHIPGSRFFDIDKVADLSDGRLPHMYPSEKRLLEGLEAVGVGKDDHVVFYDRIGTFSSLRGWWTFKIAGFHNVSVLNGGLRKWIEENRPLEGGKVEPTPISPSYVPPKLNIDLSNIVNLKYVKHTLGKGENKEKLWDTRPSGRFTGEAPDPRGLPSGRIPNSANIPFPLFSNEDGTFKSVDELRLLIAAHNVDVNSPVVCMCGSGVTATTLVFALYLLGKKTGVKVYDGSWTEWSLTHLDGDDENTRQEWFESNLKEPLGFPPK
eukprot:Platyproteum_vivax@DN8998_c0_g1_i1.p1